MIGEDMVEGMGKWGNPEGAEENEEKGRKMCSVQTCSHLDIFWQNKSRSFTHLRRPRGLKGEECCSFAVVVTRSVRMACTILYTGADFAGLANVTRGHMLGNHCVGTTTDCPSMSELLKIHDLGKLID